MALPINDEDVDRARRNSEAVEAARSRPTYQYGLNKVIEDSAHVSPTVRALLSASVGIVAAILSGAISAQQSIQIEEIAKGSGRYYVYSPAGALLEQHNTYRKARDTADACAVKNAGKDCYIVHPYLSTVSAKGLEPAPVTDTSVLGFGACLWAPLSDQPVDQVVYKVGEDDSLLQWSVPVQMAAGVAPTDFVTGPYFFRVQEVVQ